MKKYQFLTASFLISTPILADIVLQHQPGTFFNSSDMKQIKEQIRNGEDTIVLKDGTHLSSKITKFPELKFNFGTFPVSISDVAAVAISISKTGSEKIQVITGEGFNFVCDIPEEKVDIIQYFPSIEKPTHTTNQQIDLHTINYILFKERQASLSSRPQKLYRLEFKNGDQIPVVIKQENIELSNGWHDFTLPAKDIIDLNFDGGIYGVVRDSDGTEKEIDFTFVKEKYFRVQVAKSVQTLGIPWDYILNIHLEA